jgi:squalene cyclase
VKRATRLALALGAAAALPLLALTAPRAAAQEAQGESGDVTPESVAAVERALAWLAGHQNADGSWSGDVGFKLNQTYEVTDRNEPHVGVTALAGLAFLASGHVPGRGGYDDTIARATDFVLSCVQENGYITAHSTRMYSHAFATLFLAEVYGMTERGDVREKLQLAVDLIVATQNREGAWRYEPYAVESDMSIAVCQLNALRGARNVGIRVPRSTIDRARLYVQRSYVTRDEGQIDDYYRSDRGSFKYQAMKNTRSSFALTAAGLARCTTRACTAASCWGPTASPSTSGPASTS